MRFSDFIKALVIACFVGFGGMFIVATIVSFLFDIEEMSATVLWSICIGIGVATLVLICRQYGVSSACENCGKMFAMKEINRVRIGDYETTMDVQQPKKDKLGHFTTGYDTQAVPATTVIYKCRDKCKYCGHECDTRRYETYRK